MRRRRACFGRQDGRRLAGEGESEIEARQNAVALSRRAAEGWQRVGWEVAVARDLGLLADVLQRYGRDEEEAVARAGAEEIRRRWHLPEEAAAIPSNGGPIRRFVAALLRKWN